MLLRHTRGVVAALMAAMAGTAFAVDVPATTTFTYQGRLLNGGSPTTALYDFQFSLWDTGPGGGGSQLGGTLTLLNTQVTGGLFTVPLDFGAQFNSSRRWLQIAVRPAGVGSYTNLAPRQELTAAPQANGLVLPTTGNVNSSGSGLTVNNAGLGSAINGSTNGSTADAGVLATATGANSNGIIAHADNGSVAFAVWAFANQGTGIVANGGTAGGSFAGGDGVVGNSTGTGSTAYGVLGQGSGNTGVRGESSNGGGGSYGVFGFSSDVSGNGIRGEANNGGAAYGVWGVSSSGYGVVGSGSAAGGSFAGANGVVGTSTTATSTSYGVFGSGSGNTAIRGESANGGGGSYGVFGFSNASSGNGIRGECSVGSAAYAVWGVSSTGDAGHFNGNVAVVGTLSKSGGSFKIDHPLDPANQYLYHSFVESPDMMNVYNGNATIGANGTATVVMPNWFEALNREFRYQLTAVDAPSPNLYVAQRMNNGAFVIAGGTPGATVSWQITGIRQDAWANAHRIPVEEAKPALERGHFLHPELYGLDSAFSVESAYKSTPPPPQTQDAAHLHKLSQPSPPVADYVMPTKGAN